MRLLCAMYARLPGAAAQMSAGSPGAPGCALGHESRPHAVMENGFVLATEQAQERYEAAHVWRYLGASMVLYAQHLPPSGGSASRCDRAS